jgi:hypothetical protein
MAYGTYTYSKFPIDYIVGQYATHALSPTSPPEGGSIVVTGTVPLGLTADTGANTLSGYATTTGDYNLTVTIKDSGNVEVSLYKYTVVVLALDITVGTSLTAQAYTTLSQSFTYAITGSYSVTDTSTLIWVNAGSFLPLGVTLNVGTGEHAALSGSALEAGEFLVYLQVTDLDGHSVYKRFIFILTNNGTIDSSFKPSLKTVQKVGVTPNSGFTMPYTNVGGYAPGSNFHYFWTTYPSSSPIIPSGSNATIGLLTGIFTYTDTIFYDHHYRAIVRDAPIQKRVTTITNEYVSGITGSSQFDGISVSIPLIWLTTKVSPSSDALKLYSYNLDTDTTTASSNNPYTYSINTMKGPDFEESVKPTSLYIVTGPETSTTEFVLRELSTTDMSQILSKTFTVGTSGLIFNDIIRGTTVNKILLLGNKYGCYRYDIGANTIALSVINTDRYYECGVSTINSGTEYFWVLNKTDKTLIKYNPSTNVITATYNLPSANLVNSCAKNGICQSDNSYIYITDSGNGKIYIFNISGASWTTIIPSEQYSIPTSCFYDGSFIHILFQNSNNIWSAYPATLNDHYGVNLRTDQLLVPLSYSGGGSKEYDAVGPLRMGSVLIRQFTVDYGLVTLTDNGAGSFTSSNTTAIPNGGSINYCSGIIYYTEYNQGSSFPEDISYTTLPTNMIGYRRRDTYRVDWIVNNPYITSGYTFNNYMDHTVKISLGLSFNKSSNDTITPNWIINQSNKESIQINGGTPLYVPTLLDGVMPTGVSILYPDLDNTYFAIDGPATQAGLFYFTVEVDDSANSEYIYVASDEYAPRGGS